MREVMQDHPLAEELLLVCLDEYTGEPLLQADLLGYGLVAATLIELILQQRLALNEGQVVVRDARPHNDTGDPIVENIMRQPKRHLPRTWIEALSGEIVPLIGHRLAQANLVTHQESKKLFGKVVTRFPAVDPHEGARPRFWLSYLAGHPDEMDLRGAANIVILVTLGAESILAPNVTNQKIRETADQLAARTPPDVQAILAGLGTVVTAMSLKVRRI
jgi:hypothetical protein